jgi:sugar O-acyltransferase (sialic acid O-acetyltransferase NeuD family)
VTQRAVFVAGTRSFSAEIVGYAHDAGLHVVGLLEPYDRARVGQTIHDLPVTWLEETPAEAGFVLVGTGEASRRELVDRLAAAGWKTLTLVHPRAHIASTATVGVGAIVGPCVVVGACSTVGDHVVIGRGGLVGHHTMISEFVTRGPGSNVAGNVQIEPDAFIGMGAVVRDHVTVGAGSVVSMGAVVVGNVPAQATVRGIPARKVPTRATPP